MSYTDEDILDLYDHLQGIGLAETPAEEAERHRLAVLETLHSLPRGHNKFLSPVILKYVIENSIPCTYISIIIKESYSLVACPVIRGQVIKKTRCIPLEEFLHNNLEFNDFRIIEKHQNLQDLKAGLLSACERFPGMSHSRYSFLFKSDPI